MLTFKRSKSVVILAATLLVIGLLAGCSKAEEKSHSGEAGTLQGTVKVAGSSSVQPLAEELAEAFMDKNPDVNISVQGGGSSAGIESAKTGTAQIGMSSRELKDEEKGYGLTETIIAKDGIAVVVHNNNSIGNLTKGQIKRIFTGEIKDYGEIGGQNSAVTIVVREEGSGTRGAFEELVIGKGAKLAANAIVQNSSGAVKTAVARDPNAIGFISAGSVGEGVKAVKVDGVALSEATVIDRSYKTSRSFLFLTKGTQDPAVQAFIDFILSDEGQKIVSEKFIRVK
jgi:phosphate transport system substrate-binding protein